MGCLFVEKDTYKGIGQYVFYISTWVIKESSCGEGAFFPSFLQWLNAINTIQPSKQIKCHC
jgi:hypothetical protein